MRKTVLFLFVVVAILPCYSQECDEITWPDSLNTARNAEYLSEVEKDIVFEMNKVRSNPRLYAECIKSQKKYYNGLLKTLSEDTFLQTKEGAKAVDECVKFLRKAKPVGLLYPNQEITKAAKDHATDKSVSGKTGHDGSDGSTPNSRMDRYKNRINVGENISYGNNTAFDIVYQLMVDDGVPSRGHRDNIMNSQYDLCGLSINTHPVYTYVCVIDYGYILKDGYFKR